MYSFNFLSLCHIQKIMPSPTLEYFHPRSYQKFLDILDISLFILLRHQLPLNLHTPWKYVTLKEAKANILLSQERIKLQVDKHHCKTPQYTVGDKMQLETNNVRLMHTSHKLTERWLGSYKVTELVSTNAMHLCLL